MRNNILRTALLAMLGPPREVRVMKGTAMGKSEVRTDPGAEPTPVSDDSRPSLATEIQARAGRTLSSLQVKPVPPGHEHEPPPRQFNVIGDLVYVRQCDARTLQDALLRRRIPLVGDYHGDPAVIEPEHLEMRDGAGDWITIEAQDNEYATAMMQDPNAVKRLEAGLVVRMVGPDGEIVFRYRPVGHLGGER